MNITHLTSRMILDSRGYPTVEVEITLSSGATGRASVPSGASTGSREALELRDGGTLYAGKGVTHALENIRLIIVPTILEKEFSSQREFDAHLIALDGTGDKSKLGANAVLALSLAFAKACAEHEKLPLYRHLRNEFSFQKEPSLPTPLINVLNGGKHAPHSTDFQEWMIVPLSGITFQESLEQAARVFYSLREIMEQRGVSGVGDEGGFPLVNATSNEEALTVLKEAVKRAGFVPGKDIAFAVDAAASEFYENDTYTLSCDNKKLSSKEMIGYLTHLVQNFPIVSVEDGLDENDWSAWRELTDNLGSSLQLVGDDLFVTNTIYIKRGVEEKVANAVLIKVNQIGTLSETVDAIELAHSHGMQTIISHRSGETEDVTIAHLAVASGAGQIKTGSLSRTERLAKYNELLRIAEEVEGFSKPFLR